MASLALPGRSGATLAVTVTLTTARLLRRALSRKARNQPVSVDQTPSPATETPTSVELVWRDVTVHLEASGKRPARDLLHAVSGRASPGRVLAVMGPSGSGKTTLLNALAGRLPYAKAIALSGEICVNGKSITEGNHTPAYVTQDDLFFSQLTVKETLQMAAKMRLPADMDESERVAFVEALIRRLGLVGVTETAVGNDKTRGISGGEKKRLSLGCELISTPRLIMCDEPTSGLDAFQAEKVMLSLRELAAAGHTVVCSIHQPSSSIFKMCDDMVLLASGRVVYSGAAEDAPRHFKELGYPLPEQCNPAERYLELISVDFSSDETIATSEARIGKLVAGHRERTNGVNAVVVDTPAYNGIVTPVASGKKLGVLGQIGVLLQRAWRQVIRDKKTNVSRFMSSLMSGLLFGAIYWRIGSSQSTIQDRMGLLQVCTINAAMTALVKTLNVFPSEGVLVNRERARGSYSVLQYFVSKLVAEMPVSAFFPLLFSATVYPMAGLSGGLGRILRFTGIITLESFAAASYGLAIGALLSNTEAALAVGPSSFTVQVVFGGLYITEANVPAWASWIPRISLIKHAYEGLVVNEFRGMEFETKREWDVKTGEQVLERLSWGESTVMKSCISQARILAFNYLLTYMILSLKKPRFAELQRIEQQESGERKDEGAISDAVVNGPISQQKVDHGKQSAQA